LKIYCEAVQAELHFGSSEADACSSVKYGLYMC